MIQQDMAMSNPYSQLPAKAFWRSAIAEQHPLDIHSLWAPKHSLPRDAPIITAGSCFAQHIGRALKTRGYHWLDTEPAPPFVSDALKKRFNYGIFSFRTGNIYTAALFKQWLDCAIGDVAPPDEAWEENGRWYDPFRPNIEPDGFAGRAEMLASRSGTLSAIRSGLEGAEIIVFTLGLTEAWLNRGSGHVYPMCPGTVRGIFLPDAHVFKNYGYAEIKQDLTDALDMIKRVNPKARFLLTVSPVPLTATAAGEHVLVATNYSKSTLRAVAGDTAARTDTDYFPSYEIITSFPFRGMFFEPNLRNVSPHGVDFVMDTFFRCLNEAFPSSPDMGPQILPSLRPVPDLVGEIDDDVQCEEELLSAFSPSAAP